METLPKNRPKRRDFVFVNRAQFDHIFSDVAAAKGDEIAKSLATLKDDIAPACDKRFVLFKNKFFSTWIQLGLIPEGLKPKHERLFKSFIDDYSKIEEYVSCDANKNIIFDGERFKADVLSGKFTATVFDYDFDIRKTLDGVISWQRQYTGSVDSLKQELLNCDHIYANIQPYEERQLTDVNRGHWELFEDAASDSAKVQLPEGEFLVVRPPQLDVRLNGICAIDFGTKSTIVVCRDGESRMLRIGQGDYTKAPTMRDFENPTVIELRDLRNFLVLYRERDGRPFTEWNQVTVSHQAADALFKKDVSASVYNSVFNELKQWAKDEQSYPVLKDLNGAILTWIIFCRSLSTIKRTFASISARVSRMGFVSHCRPRSYAMQR